MCVACGGSQTCQHGTVRFRCKQCGAKEMCKHRRVQANCKECSGGVKAEVKVPCPKGSTRTSARARSAVKKESSVHTAAKSSRQVAIKKETAPVVVAKSSKKVAPSAEKKSHKRKR